MYVSAATCAHALRHGSAYVAPRDLNKDMRPAWVERSVEGGMVERGKEKRSWNVGGEGDMGTSRTVWVIN